ncbi:MAG: hypothetical protein IPL55_04075 [Saprospiraceae bacterium]|nr:hypothetical protein [Saprospiraceae bacterium]
MQRVSSNSTIFFKLFIPTVWIVFFTTFTAALFIVDSQSLPLLTSPLFKYPFLLIYVLFFCILYFTFMQLKRVELAGDFYYVSNYFKTYKMVYDEISSINMINLGGLQLIIFRLNAKGSFGNKIVFLASRQLMRIFLDTHPDVEKILTTKQQ